MLINNTALMPTSATAPPRSCFHSLRSLSLTVYPLVSGSSCMTAISLQVTVGSGKRPVMVL